MAKSRRQPMLAGFEDTDNAGSAASSGQFPIQPTTDASKVEPDLTADRAAEAPLPSRTPPQTKANAQTGAIRRIPPVEFPLTASVGGAALNPSDTSSADLSGDTANVCDKTVYVVDAHALIYQVFHAMPEMTSPQGRPVGAVQGFIRDMVDLIEHRGAEFILVAFDPPGPNFRHELFDQYKIHREEMPADLKLQIPVIHQFLEALGLLTISVPGYEADDVMATVARLIEQCGGNTLLVTSDKDCRQLITDKVKILNIRKNEVCDAAALKTIWGIRPDQVIDFQSLVGDTIDNIPGVPLIGPKIAAELLQKYDTLENVFEHAHEMSGTKRRENLINGKEQAMISRQLVRLDPNVPLSIDWQAAKIGKFRPEEVDYLCRTCGFKQLARRLEALMKRYGQSLPVEPSGDEDLLGPTGDIPLTSGLLDEAAEVTPAEITPAAPAAPWDADYRLISTVDELSELVAKMVRQRRISVDTETTSTHPRWAEIVGYSFAWAPGEAYYVPVMAPEGEIALDPNWAKELLRPILEDPVIEKIGQNIKYDMIVLRNAGVELRGIAFDTMVADYLLDPGERNHNLDDLARRHLGHENITIESLIGSGKTQKRMDEVPVAAVAQYAAEDADVPLRLTALLEPRLREQELADLFSDLEIPLIEVLAELEFNGIRVDRARLQQLSGEFAERIARLQSEIYELAEAPFNIDSRLQLSKLLFDQLKLPVLKKTKTGPSTDAEVLEDLARMHPLPAKIMDYRHNTKLKNTYVDSLQELIHPTTGRVHTSFKQDVAATGRLSSSDPNLQNIPIRTEQGRAIRSAFLPGPEGWRLLTADYSQIELRVLAHFSGDATLKEAFDADRDIHSQVASEVYGVPLAEVTSAMRRSAKAINFGVIYGQSPFGLAKTIDIEQSDAAKFIDAYFARLPGVDVFMQKTLVECRRLGYVTTISGRRRPVQGVRDPATLRDKRQRNLPERIAINTVIQGSAADIIKRAMLNVYRRLKKEQLQSKMLLQIHDELVFEFPPDEEQKLIQLVSEEMSAATELSVPLRVDVKTGLNWAECEPV
jgi:DNA polymerase-1